MLNRRTAVLTLLSLPMGYFKAFASQRGWLTVDLSQWAGVRVMHEGKEIVLTGAEIFEALQ